MKIRFCTTAWIAWIKKDRDIGIERYSSTNELFLEYMEASSGRVRIARRRAELEVWLGWIGTALNLGSTEEEEVWIPNSVGRLLTRMDCFP